jgi:hypothetical protein
MSNTLPEITFGKPIERPKVVRNTALANPFRAAVQEFIDAGDASADKAIPFTVPMGKATPQTIKGKATGKTEHKDVLRVLSRLRSAAPEGYGVRTAVQYDTPSKGVATVAFWVKPKTAADADADADADGDADAETPAADGGDAGTATK